MSELLTNTSPPSPSLDRPHVLVVDDDDRLRELLRRYLAENGFLVATAADAARARAKLTSLTFDVSVLDLMMPGESGLDFARALEFFYQPPKPTPGIHATTVIAPSAVVGENASIGRCSGLRGI